MLAGNYVVACCYDGSIHLYMIPDKKKYWSSYCDCHLHNVSCDVDHVIFTEKDTRIVT